MLEIVRSTQFKKDLKKIIKQGKDLDLLQEIVDALQRQEPLLPKTVIIRSLVTGKFTENVIFLRIGCLSIKVKINLNYYDWLEQAHILNYFNRVSDVLNSLSHSVVKDYLTTNIIGFI